MNISRPVLSSIKNASYVFIHVCEYLSLNSNRFAVICTTMSEKYNMLYTRVGALVPEPSRDFTFFHIHDKNWIFCYNHYPWQWLLLLWTLTDSVIIIIIIIWTHDMDEAEGRGMDQKWQDDWQVMNDRSATLQINHDNTSQ